jgi:hypothetical protein
MAFPARRFSAATQVDVCRLRSRLHSHSRTHSEHSYNERD